MKYKLLIAALPFAAALAPSADAAAFVQRSFTFSGVACQPTRFANASNCLERDQFGVQNSCGFDVSVECPVNLSFDIGTATSLNLQAYDRNPATDVECDLQRVDANGNPTFSTHIKTNGSGPGVQSLFNGGIGSPLLAGAWRLRCNLPAVSGGAISHLVSYELSLLTNQ